MIQKMVQAQPFGLGLPHQPKTSSRIGPRVWRTGLVLLWLGALELMAAVPRVGLWFAAAAIVVIAWVASRWPSRMHPWARAGLIIWVCAASLIMLLVAPGPNVRQLMIAVSLVALGVTLVTESASDHPKVQGRVAAVAVLFVLLASYYALLNFGSGIFVIVKPWWLALSGAAIMLGMSALGWSAAEIPFSKYARGLPLAALIGAELFIVTWWLPTATYVGSILASTIAILWIQTTRHVWRGDWEAGRGRRYLFIGSVVVVGVLATARWI